MYNFLKVIICIIDVKNIISTFTIKFYFEQKITYFNFMRKNILKFYKNEKTQF